MIPIKLSIQGLYSYQDKQEIDFRQLVGSSVFGIFGKVGSGKTSLLEAISFALYGKTERLNSQDNQKYNMMNLKSKHLIIDFEFQAGPHQQLYRFVYEAKRHPKKHHEVNAGDRRMYTWQDNTWQPIGKEKEDVGVLSKQILGLDYENFKRTIIIPQNQFREFLELTPVDRTKMMSQLFRLDQYDLAGRVSKLSKANDGALSELRGRLAPLTDVTPEAIEQAEVASEDLQKARTETETRISLLEPTEQQLLHAKKQSELLAIAWQELANWLTQQEAHQVIEQEIVRYEQCRLQFRGDLAQLDKLQSKKSDLLEAENKACHIYETVTDALPRLQAAYDAAQLVYETRDRITERIDELDTVQQMRTVQNAIEQQTRNQQQLDTLAANQKKHIDGLKKARDKQLTTVDSQLGHGSDLERLYKVQAWFTEYKPLKKQADSLQNQTDAYDQSVEKIKQRRDDALEGFPVEWLSLPLKLLPDTIDEAIKKLEAIEEERENTHRRNLLNAELYQYADSLTDGQPCPLCGSSHHPARHEPAESGPDVAKSDSALQKVKARIKDMTALRLTIEKLVSELRGTIENGKRLIQERGEVVKQLTVHDDAFVWGDFTKDQSTVVADAIKTESKRQQQLQDAQKALRELNGQIEDAANLLCDQNEKVARMKADLAGMDGQLQSSAKSLTHYQLADVVKLDLIQIEDLRESLTRQYAHAKTAFVDAENARNTAEKEQVTADSYVRELARQRQAIIDELTDLDRTIVQNLVDKGLTREQLRQILEHELDVEAGKKRVKDYEDKLCGLQSQVSTLEAQLISQPFDPIALAALQEELKNLRAEKDELNKAIGKAGNVLTTLKQQWVEKKTHQKQYDTLDLRRQDLEKMSEMFRAQGFVNYVSSVYLTNLCQSANERFFGLTNNQLKLELDERNNFLVRDYLNGGEVRSVKTLSGGQTFQAALSLALALSDNIQHLTQAKQNLFFLDEGFGTLDKDALQTVFKTLKALRSENRVVGIISHVEELQHEVDNYIRAEATAEGSRIVRSWE